MIKTTLKIDGMACSMCESHICDVIRNTLPSAKKVSASAGKKEAFFISDDDFDADALKAAIDKTGYKCLSVNSEPFVKKGLFGR